MTINKCRDIIAITTDNERERTKMSNKRKKEKEKRFTVLGKRLNTLRGDLSQVKFAEKVGLTAATIGYYENSDRLPDAETLYKICVACDCSSDYLLGISEAKKPQIDVQAANKRYGLGESNLQTLEKITVLARLHEKHQLLTDSIMRIERTFKSTRNDNPTEDFITELLAEQKKLEVELETLETEMFELTDPGEGYFKPPKWTAPIVCQRAWQRLHSIGALLAFTEGEKVLDEIGEYLYMGDVVDGIVRTSNETISSLISGEDIAKIKLFNIQKGLVKMREEISKQNNGGLNNGTDEN